MKIDGFQARCADGRTVVELGPRYRKPLDRTTDLRVFHRTIGGGASFLLEREQFTELRTWLGTDHLRELVFKTPLHYARLRSPFPGTVSVSVGWKSASGGRGIGTLSAADTAALAAWTADKDDHGWTGWREPPAGAVCRCSPTCPASPHCAADGRRHMHADRHVGCPLHPDAYTMTGPVR
jgi:hypothetical protein